MTRILFVCTGNICRSPTAEGVARHFIETGGLGGRVEVDSAGTQGYHVGEAPDPRAQKFARQRGYDLSRSYGYGEPGFTYPPGCAVSITTPMSLPASARRTRLPSLLAIR